jgi:hypothetical protein
MNTDWMPEEARISNRPNPCESVFFRGEIFRVFPGHHSVSPRRVSSRESQASRARPDSAAIVLEL